MIYRVYVEFKTGILDPESEAIKKTINHLGFKNIENISKGKFFDIELSSDDGLSDIEKISKDDYRITMALAGFSEDDLEIELDAGVLSISAEGTEEEANQERFLHRGIAKRAFKRHFRLAETIKVLGAEFENGLLMIDLQREIPEHLKPRQIKINNTKVAPKLVDEEAA